MSLPRASGPGQNAFPADGNPASPSSAEEQTPGQGNDASSGTPSNSSSAENASSAHTPPLSPRSRAPTQPQPQPQPLLQTRERSKSNPVLLQPIGKDTASPPVSPRPTMPTAPQSGSKTPVLPSSVPKLSLPLSSPLSSPRNAPPSVLSPHGPALPANRTSMLASLAVQNFLKKDGDFDQKFPADTLPANLRMFVRDRKANTITLPQMIIQSFKADLKDSTAWEIALDLSAKMKNMRSLGEDEEKKSNPNIIRERKDLQHTYAASLAGAFFNLSTADRLQRLPSSLLSFLEAADHQLIQYLQSTGDNVKLNAEQFTSRRKALFTQLLLDSFLVPVITTDLFRLGLGFANDKMVSLVIDALTQAAGQIAPNFLQQSLKNAPPEVSEAIVQKRMSQFREKPGTGDRPSMRSLSISTGNSNQIVSPLSPRNAGLQCRRELGSYLAQLCKHFVSPPIPDDLLERLKQANNELAAQGRIFDKQWACKHWAQVATAWNPSHPVTQALAEFYYDLRATNEFSDLLDRGMREIGQRNKLVLTTSVTMPTTTTVLATATTTTTVTTTVTPVPLVSQVSPSSLATSNAEQLGSGRRPITRAPKTPRGEKSDATVSPSSGRLTRHQRSRTADATMPMTRPGIDLLDGFTRSELLAGFPTWMVGAFSEIARKHPSDPVRSIIEVQRNKLLLNGMPTRASTASTDPVTHVKLLQLLFRDTMKSSPIGQALLAKATLASNQSADRPNVLNSANLSHAEFLQTEMDKQLQPLAKAFIADTFSQGLSKAGLPEDLLAFWIDTDRSVRQWAAGAVKLSTVSLDELRSSMGFDLIVTRLIYPLALGEGIPSPTASRFANAVRKEINEAWPTLFAQFKELATGTAVVEEKSLNTKEKSEQ